MTIRAPVNEFGLLIPSGNGVVTLGATVTPGNNTYGTYAQMLAGAAVTDEAYGIWVTIYGNAVSASARDAIGKIGLDAAGGTTYTDAIIDFSCSAAGSLSGASGGGGGITLYFPLRITAGSSIAIAVSVNNATVGTCTAFCRLVAKPTGPTPPRAGAFVRTFGSTPASSSGTAVTPGNSAKSAWVQMGSAVADSLWYWTLSVCNNNAVYGNNNPSVWDLGIGSSTTTLRIIILDQIIIHSTSESMSFTSIGAYGLAAPGDLIFIRAATQGAPQTGFSAIAHGTGG